MDNSLKQLNLKRLIELIDKVIERESIAKQSESYDDLGWVKFYAKELMSECKECKPK